MANTGMEQGEMRRLLQHSKQEPVSCAIGVGEDKRVALLVLDKIRSATSLQNDLKKQFPNAFNYRCGTAVVDTETDPTLVKFMLTKAVTSMAQRLVKTLKGTGFRKVQILLEDGSPVEESAIEEEDAPRADGAPQASPAQAVPKPAAPQPDAAALAQVLTGLVRQIGAVTDPARKEALATQAREANANIKTGNLVYAAVGIESLRRALASPSAPADEARDAAPPPPPPPPPAQGQSPVPRQTKPGAEPPSPPPPPPPVQGQSPVPRQTKPSAEPPPNPPGSGMSPGSDDPRAAQYQAAFGKLVGVLEKVVETAPQRRDAIDLQTEIFKAAMASGDFAQAKEALMEMGLLARPAANAAAESGADIAALNIAFRKSRLAWGQTRQKVHGQIRQFQSALRDELRGEPDFADMDFKISLLDGVLKRLDGSLETKLDDAMNAEKAAVKLQLKQASRQQVMDYISFVNENPMIARLDSNSFMPMTVCADLTGQLADLAQTLA
jgi:hypothetical protein